MGIRELRHDSVRTHGRIVTVTVIAIVTLVAMMLKTVMRETTCLNFRMHEVGVTEQSGLVRLLEQLYYTSILTLQLLQRRRARQGLAGEALDTAAVSDSLRRGTYLPVRSAHGGSLS
jgi:hypothetical protein